MAVIERLLEDGVDDRAEIVTAVGREIDIDVETLRRMAAGQSGCRSRWPPMRDGDGERLAFPSRDEDGNRTIVHVRFTKDAWAVHRAGVHLEKVGKSMVRSGQRLQERAVQLGLDLFDEHNAA
jgi:hypothetical protein